jgi:pantoate--beta-alanine ligase
LPLLAGRRGLASGGNRHTYNIMLIFKEAHALTEYLAGQARPIGFAPTMGALHPGHLSLIAAARQNGQQPVCSIFVNPTQFNNATDFAKYPITTAQDINLLEGAGCEVLFLPDTAEVYPYGTAPSRQYELGYLETVLEGQYRPGHFQGVCQVVHRLLNILRPDTLYLGQKDYQQCMVLQQLVRLLELPTQVSICPTIREADGLAMSSRNLRLSPSDRRQAAALSQTLRWVLQTLRPGPLNDLKQSAKEKLALAGFEVDYLELAHAETLELLDHWDGQAPVVALAAAFLGEIRLIDNMVR